MIKKWLLVNLLLCHATGLDKSIKILLPQNWSLITSFGVLVTHFVFWFIVMSGVNSKGVCFLLTICQSLKIHLGFEVLIRIMRVLCQRVNVLHVWAKYGELSEVDYDLIKNNILLFYNKYKLKIVLEYSNSMNS